MLMSLGLDRYIAVFTQHEIDLTTFGTLTDHDLMEIGINAFGARRKILLAISGKKRFRYGREYKLLRNISTSFRNVEFLSSQFVVLRLKTVIGTNVSKRVLRNKLSKEVCGKSITKHRVTIN